MLKPYYEWLEPQSDIFDKKFDEIYNNAQEELIKRFSEFCKYSASTEEDPDLMSFYWIKCRKCFEELEAPTEDELLGLALQKGWGISPLVDDIFCAEHLTEEIENFIRG